MVVYRCDRCGKDCKPFTYKAVFYQEPPQVLGFDLCEYCYSEVEDFVRHMPRWREFSREECPEIGQKIILDCPDTGSTEVVIWSAENQRTYDGFGYRIFRWKPWKEIDSLGTEN